MSLFVSLLGLLGLAAYEKAKPVIYKEEYDKARQESNYLRQREESRQRDFKRIEDANIAHFHAQYTWDIFAKYVLRAECNIEGKYYKTHKIDNTDAEWRLIWRNYKELGISDIEAGHYDVQTRIGFKRKDGKLELDENGVPIPTTQMERFNIMMEDLRGGDGYSKIYGSYYPEYQPFVPSTVLTGYETPPKEMWNQDYLRVSSMLYASNISDEYFNKYHYRDSNAFVPYTLAEKQVRDAQRRNQ